ncbi:hypothetical protein P4493_04840 [Bacillus thuringiensis]|jgi:hypothetical protein|uniref:Uncharacterized protein n=1 Tax=Bacillus thuringiensis TaxID=1428 RepID=A0AB33AR04_BACTU|nr:MULTISPECIES: hypothetical protein [Bacillus]MEC2534363.1 hypothetical protein [Bacillus cereus]MED1153680.1 hypothetical protein [Bacillus paranthracis]AJG74184.1 hypothetical protein BF38_5795 [Bacillus thuringiensis]AJH02605.1 hypothetical protein AS86_6105 [Bacillus thuringiensis HD1002]MEB4827453.1 hypothetical protein [Bacillus thuringiensis]
MEHKLSNVPYIKCKNCGKETIQAIHFKVCQHCKQVYTKKASTDK